MTSPDDPHARPGDAPDVAAPVGLPPGEPVPAASEDDPIGGDAAAAPPPAPVGTCPACGARVEQRPFCEECGADLVAGPSGAAASARPVGPSPTDLPPLGDPSAQETIVLPVVPPGAGNDERAAAPAAPVHADEPDAQAETSGGATAVSAAPAPDRQEPDERSGDGMLVLGQGPGAVLPVEPVGTEEGVEPASPCPDCGGAFVDGYCETCGAPAPDPARHREDSPASWVAGVCDIGVHHQGNQDAMALSARDGGSVGALVVCDGVSSAMRAEEASQAAADAALAVLTSATSHGVAGVSSLVGALHARLDDATDAASDAVRRVTHEGDPDAPAAEPGVPSASNPSCTFVAAAIEDGVVVVGSVGDSRAYWLPDGEPAQQLTTDDSWAQEEIRLGAAREVAERGPHAHTITRWLGVDAPDHTPGKTALQPTGPGWLLLCSDGLWNYASEPEALGDVVAQVSAEQTEQAGNDIAGGGADPLALARGLVTWANAQGGHDNITVALARLVPGATRQNAVDAVTERQPVVGDEDPLGQNPTIVVDSPGAAAAGPATAGEAPGPDPRQNATHG